MVTIQGINMKECIKLHKYSELLTNLSMSKVFMNITKQGILKYFKCFTLDEI